MSDSGVAVARISLVALASAWVSGDGSSRVSDGHSDGLLNHDGPFLHSSLFTTLPPRLPTSAGLTVVGT